MKQMKKWQMKFNVGKCCRLQISGKKPVALIYAVSLNDEVLDSFQRHPYLEVEFDKDFKWGSHIGKFVRKANRSLWVYQEEPLRVSKGD